MKPCKWCGGMSHPDGPCEPEEEPKQVQAPEVVWLGVHGDGSCRVIDHPDDADYNETAVRYVKAGGQ